MQPTPYYEGFSYPGTSLLKFLQSGNLFSIYLKNKEIVHHHAAEPRKFRLWLLHHGVRDVFDTQNKPDELV